MLPGWELAFEVPQLISALPHLASMAGHILRGKIPDAGDTTKVAAALFSMIKKEVKETTNDEFFFTQIQSGLKARSVRLSGYIDQIFEPTTGFSPKEIEVLQEGIYTFYKMNGENPGAETRCVDFLEEIAHQKTVAGMRQFLEERRYFLKLRTTEAKREGQTETIARLKDIGKKAKEALPEYWEKTVEPITHTLVEIENFVTKKDSGSTSKKEDALANLKKEWNRFNRR